MALIIDVLPQKFYLLINAGLCMYYLNVKYHACNPQTFCVSEGSLNIRYVTAILGEVPSELRERLGEYAY
jgi:hypothetical protein